jgi:hypothetical protein
MVAEQPANRFVDTAEVAALITFLARRRRICDQRRRWRAPMSPSLWRGYYDGRPGVGRAGGGDWFHC